MNPDKISERQCKRMLFVEGFGAAGLTAPAAAMVYGGKGCPSFLVYGVLLALFGAYFLWVVRRIERRGDGAGFPASCPKWIGCIYFLRYMVNAAALLAFFGLSIRSIYMPDFASWAVLLPCAAVLWYLMQTTLQKRARFLEILFPWIMTLLVLMLAFSLAGLWGRMTPLTPLEDFPAALGNGYLLLLCGSPLEFLLFLLPAARESLWSSEEKACGRGNVVRKALLLVFAANLFLWFVTAESLGRRLTVSTPWPVVKLMQLIRLPGGVFERFDALLVFFWVLCMIGVVSGYLYYGRRIAEGSFPVFQERRKALAGTAVLMIFVYAAACLAASRESLLWGFLFYKKWIDFPLALLLPWGIIFRKKTPGKDARGNIQENVQKSVYKKWEKHLKEAVKGYLKEHFMKKSFATIFLIFSALALNGCAGSVDIEEKSYLLSLYVEEEGDGYRFRAAAADLAGMEIQDGLIPCTVTTVTAASLAEMEEKYRAVTTGVPEWNHVDVLFIGERLQEDPERLLTFLGEWESAWQKTPNALLVCSDVSPGALYTLDAYPDGSAGEAVSLLEEQLRKREETADVCRTPIECLKAYYEGSGEETVYTVSRVGNRLQLSEKEISLLSFQRSYHFPSVFPEVETEREELILMAAPEPFLA